MNTLILLVGHDSAWSPALWAADYMGECGSGGQFMVERDAEWLSIIRSDRVLDDFDESERSRLQELVVKPAAYLLEWKGGGFLETLLRSIPTDVCAAIDNDHGLLVSVRNVVGKPLESWVKASELA